MATERIRTTISLDPEVHEIFKRMAEAAGMSISRCMGDWLADTSEGAQFVAQKMVQARQSPMLLMREMQSFSAGLTDEVNRTVLNMRDELKAPSLRSGVGAATRPATPSAAPSSNTGLKETKPLLKRKKNT